MGRQAVFLALLMIQFMTLVLGMWLGHRVTERHPATTLRQAQAYIPLARTVAVPVVALLLVSVVSQIHDGVSQLLPLWFQSNATSVTWAILAGLFPFLLAFTATFAWYTRHRSRRRLLFLVVIANVVLVPVQFQINWPIAELLSTEVREVTLQSTGSSCVPASLANVAHRYGVALSEREAARYLGTTFSGNSLGDVRHALHRLGIPHRTLNARTNRLADVSTPAILLVDHPAVGRERHAVVFFGRAGGGFEVWDPLTGVEIWSPRRIALDWHGNGIECLARHD